MTQNMSSEYFRYIKNKPKKTALNKDFKSVSGGFDKVITNFARLIYREQLAEKSLIPQVPQYYDDIENSYENRILDALARMMYVDDKDTVNDQKQQLICCAVSIVRIEDRYKFLISYNNSPAVAIQDGVKAALTKIKEVAAGNQSYTDLVDYYLSINHYFYCHEYKEALKLNINIDFSKLLEELRISEQISENEFVDFARGFKEGGFAYIGNFFRLVKHKPENYEGFNEYVTKTLLDAKKEIVDDIEYWFEDSCPVDTLNSDECKQKILGIVEELHKRKMFACNRLLQDCYKVISNFNKSILSKLFEIDDDSIEFLGGASEMHAELRIYEKYISSSLRSYIGISKLSCWVCDIHIRFEEQVYADGESQILHFGTSDTVYPPTKLPEFHNLKVD